MGNDVIRDEKAYQQLILDFSEKLQEAINSVAGKTSSMEIYGGLHFYAHLQMMQTVHNSMATSQAIEERKEGAQLNG